MRKIYLYNTLTRRKEEFLPLVPDEVKMYTCGVTVYDQCHLGHARAYVSFDVVRRYLEHNGYRVTYVQNFTDIDDKIIRRAQELRESTGSNQDIKTLTADITRKYTEEYFLYMDKLGLERATAYPKATEHIPEMIQLIEQLMESELAYEVEGDVYFAVDKCNEYGKLSHRSLEELQAGARVEIDARKRNPLDFALWKRVKPGEPSWTSPWGEGRPGWHIECSAMSIKYLGIPFDIHAGGQDLIFPHHENEIAQSEGATGKQFARYWLHNGFVTINKEKMSKSLGNFFTLREIFEKYEPAVVRLLLLATHYRSPIDFSDDKLLEAEKMLNRLIECEERVDRKIGSLKEGTITLDNTVGELEKYRESFETAIADDFNTARALGVLFNLVNFMNNRVDREQSENVKKVLKSGLFLLQEFKNILGLEKIVIAKHCLEDTEVSGEVKKLVTERETARKEENWQQADLLRQEILKLGFIVEDHPQGSVLKRRV